MRIHAEYFKLFLDVGPTRRAPKRKAAAGAKQSIVGPTEDAIDKAFAQHLKRMSQSGVYGDNMEISAFSRDYNCDVKIYQRDFAYVVTSGAGAPGPRKTMHIAYHVSVFPGRSPHSSYFLPPSPPPFPRPSHKRILNSETWEKKFIFLCFCDFLRHGNTIRLFETAMALTRVLQTSHRLP